MAEANTDLMTTVVATPAEMFSNPKLPEQLFAHIEATIRDFVPDLTTDKGRKAIASLAAKVTTTKTAVDAAGKALNEERRKAINAVDAERRTYWARLEELQKLARKPLTDWEATEATRLATIETTLDTLRKAAIVPMGETAAAVKERLDAVQVMTFDPAIFLGMFDAAELEQRRTIETLTSMHAQLVQSEADAAELARLKREEAERQERQRRDEEEARAAREKQEREARAAEEAELAAKRREDAAAAEAKRKADAEAQAAIDAANKRAADAEAAIKAEEERKAQEQRAAEQRAADQKHRERVIERARDDIMSLLPSLAPAQAMRIVEGIVRGEVSRVTLEF